MNIQKEECLNKDLKVSIKDFISKLTCPITKKIFLNPVIGEDGIIYEEEIIEELFSEDKLNPITNEKISYNLYNVYHIKFLIDNLITKSFINVYFFQLN